MSKKTLDLVASENILSPLTRLFLLSSYSEKYFLSNETIIDFDNYTYPVDKKWLNILGAGKDLINEIFGSTWNDQRPLSGTHAMLCLLSSLTSPGDSIIISPESAGGHFATQYIAKRLGLNIYYNEYNIDEYGLDPVVMKDFFQQVKPKLVTLDVSHQLFPHPVTKFREYLPKNAIITYDASHVLGLLAGDELQRPLKEGADLIHGGTHKTFPGTQKAIFLGTNEKLKMLIDQTIFPQFSSNNHLHHILANFAAFLEMKIFGKAYAQQTIKNAKVLATELDNLNVPVMAKERGFTETHQIWINIDHKYVHILNEYGIRVTSFYVPKTDYNKRAIRLGTNLVTRLGFKEHDMKIFAEFIHLALERKIPQNILRKRISDYIEANEKMEYSFTRIDEIEKQGTLGELLVKQIEEEQLQEIFNNLVKMYGVVNLENLTI